MEATMLHVRRDGGSGSSDESLKSGGFISLRKSVLSCQGTFVVAQSGKSRQTLSKVFSSSFPKVLSNFHHPPGDRGRNH